MKILNLIPARLLKRYKRFLADVELDNGEVVTAHCPNSGRMTGCCDKNCKVLISSHDNPKRKLKFTLEYTSNDDTWIVVNTNRANELAYESVTTGKIPELANYQNYKREVPYGQNSRIDILAENIDEKCWIEVKSVTMLDANQNYCFPDAPTVRGQKHLNELMAMKAKGDRAVMLFIVLREDGNNNFTAADFIDPIYAKLLKQSHQQGVEILAYKAKITESEITIDKQLNVILLWRQ